MKSIRNNQNKPIKSSQKMYPLRQKIKEK